jgi:hypothetical protein
VVKDLSKYFGAVDHAIDGLDDAESKNRLDQMMNVTGEALAAAMHELSLAIRKLPSYRSTSWRTLQRGSDSSHGF